jgi:hypothetical protein
LAKLRIAEQSAITVGTVCGNPNFGRTVSHNDKQILGGFEHLHRMAAEVADGGWLTGTTKITQADVTTVVAYTFADTVRPKLGLPQTVPTVIALCSAMRSFAKAPVPPAFN